MQANVGDQLVLRSDSVGKTDRTGEITEIRGPNGAPPYMVRFEDGHQSLIYPGPDCLIRPS
ncbi:DUF1918 domain-containing protein [Nocardia sp. NPDC019395]|uniref:DUF1918 domain-containing protein n=1 Tax=Nocardia sp. NPDC019395 TaxID=3154686 RepID=UPI003408E0F6